MSCKTRDHHNQLSRFNRFRHVHLEARRQGRTGHPGTLTIGTPAFDFQFQPKVVRKAHATRRIPFHRVNPTISSARAGRHHSPGFGRQPVDPLTGCDWLPRLLIGAKRGLITFVLDRFVWYRSFDYENEGFEFSLGGEMKVFHELIAVFVCEERIVELHFWDTWESSEYNVLDTRLGSRSHRDRITIATKTRGDPQNVKFFIRW